MEDARVVVIGGGPAGLCLSLGLAYHGVSNVVLERAIEPVAESRAIVIWPRTADVLRDWGAWDRFRHGSGLFHRTFAACNASTGDPIIAIDFTQIDDIAEEPGVLYLPQDETERTLRELVAADPLCDLRTGAEVTDIEQDRGNVIVRYRRNDRDEAVRAEYAAGCDGAHGLTRHVLGLELEGMTYKARVLLTDEMIPGSEALCSPRVVLNQPGLLGAIAWSPGKWRVLASLDALASDDAAADSKAHAQRLTLIFGTELAANANTTWRSLFRIHRRHARSFAVGRVALVGDAAHLNSPAGGQGMNAAIHDSANLAWKLAYALDGSDGPLLVESYDAERREIIADTVERFTDRATRFGIGMPSIVRRFALRMFSKAVRGRGMQRKLCRAFGMLGGRYARSPIVDPIHPLAGRRLDDLAVSGGVRIHALRKGRIALVRVGTVDDAAVEALPAIDIAQAPKRWCVKPPAVLIVRPDGVVASVVEKPSEQKIKDAWERAFAGRRFLRF